MQLDDLMASLTESSEPADKPATGTAAFEPLPQRLDALADTQADATAIVDMAGQYTRAQLRDISRSIASLIVSLGQPRQTSVIVMTGRSRLQYAAALAVWRVGCIYVPLDPQLPVAGAAEPGGHAGACFSLSGTGPGGGAATAVCRRQSVGAV